MPVVARRIGDDAQRRVEHLHLGVQKLDDDGLPARLGHDEMDRRSKAEGRLNDGHDADLGHRFADLADGRIVGQEVLPDIGRTHRLSGLRRVIGLILGEARVIEEADCEALFIHSLDDQIFSDGIDSDDPISALP
jgi:hypothetical protein